MESVTGRRREGKDYSRKTLERRNTGHKNVRLGLMKKVGCGF